ncbi:retrotransposon protein, putative, ty1-copia subclass [Tanacetum coccineum]
MQFNASSLTSLPFLDSHTISSTNNSVFRGFFEKQKLTGPNFIDWYRQLRIVLSIDDKLNYLEQPLPPAPVAPAGQHVAPEILAAHTAWVKGIKEINYNMHSLGKTVNELHAMLKLHEQTLNLPKNNAPALHAIRAGKVQKGSWDYRPSYSSLHSTTQWLSRGWRGKQTLLDMVRSMMSQTTLLKSFWDYALETAARILNMVPTKKVEKTPYEVWHGQAPKLSYLKVWGCEALVKRDTLTKPDKLEPRSIKCIFIGYPKETMGYSFYYPPENKVLVARNAEFLENSLINQEASGSLEDLEIIQEEDTHPSIDTSLNHEEDDLEMDEPQIDNSPFVWDLGEPANYKAALLDPESDKWLNAMNVEMQSMKDNEVWILVELPPNGKTVGSKWLFKKKTDMDGAVHTYKARLVAKGYTQTPGLIFDENLSSPLQTLELLDS